MFYEIVKANTRDVTLTREDIEIDYLSKQRQIL